MKNIRYIFWQDIFSLHQSYFINELALSNDVTLVVEQGINKRRINDGWNIPKYYKTVNRFINPGYEDKIRLLDQPETLHLFFGIDAYPMVYEAFRLAIQKKVKMAVIQEPVLWVGFKGLFRVAKWILLRVRFSKNILFYLNTGFANANFVNRLCYKRSKLFEWAYFIDPVEEKKIPIKQTTQTNLPSILFIGSIDKRKNIINIIKYLKKSEKKFNFLTIIGGGPLEQKLNTLIAGNSKYKYIGRKKREEIWELINNSDLLILPSIWDGWGFVINEALSSGIPVIASNRCGASRLLDNNKRGGIFKNNIVNFNKVLNIWLKKIPLNTTNSDYIKDWTNRNISGKSGAKYFNEVVEVALSGKQQKPRPPWVD